MQEVPPTMTGPVLRFSVLGAVSAIDAAGKNVEFSNRKIWALAVMLAIEPERRHSRSELAERIWPQPHPEAGLASLRNALSALRKDLGRHDIDPDSVVSADKVTLALVSGSVESDLRAAEALIEHARSTRGPAEKTAAYREALELIASPFAPGWTADWATAKRAALEEKCAGAMTELAAAAKEAGELDAAIPALAKASKADPLNEAKLVVLLRALSDLGQYSQVVQEFRRFERSLRDQLAMAPSATTTALARRARSQSKPAWEPPASNLGQRTHEVFGRAGELQLLQSILEGGGSASRLATLIGPGGIGKTTVATDAALRSLRHFGRAVWFIDLTAVTRATDISVKVAECVAPDLSAENSTAGLASVIADSPLLLVLDNLEQVGPGAGAAVLSLLGALPKLRVVATSRKPLGVPGEVTIRLGAINADSSKEDAESDPGVRLFRDRSARVATGGNGEGAEQIRELVDRLEGNPLAICLAAAHVDVLTVGQLIAGLVARFELLRSGEKDRPARHQSLANCIGWSMDLVPECLPLMRALAPFRGGWTVSLAEAVMADGHVASRLQALLRLALVDETARDDQIRFSMSESVREFVLQSLSAQESQDARRIHAEAMLDWLRKQQPAGQAYSISYMRARTAEYENLRSAFEWWLAQDPNLAVEMANSLAYYWWSKEAAEEGLDWLQRAVCAVPDEPSAPLAMAHRAIAMLHTSRSQYGLAIASLEKGLTLLPAASPPDLHSRFLNSVGNALMRVGEHAPAIDNFRAAMKLALDAGHGDVAALTEGNIGFAHYLAGELDEAERCLSSSIDKIRKFGNSDWEAHMQHNLGLVAMARGKNEQARERFDRARDILAENNAEVNAAERSWLSDAATVSFRLGELEVGLRQLKESADAVARVKGDEQKAEVVDAAALYCESKEDWEGAAAFLSTIEGDGVRPQRSAADVSPTLSSRLAHCKKMLEPSLFRLAQRKYRGLTLDDLLEEIEEL